MVAAFSLGLRFSPTFVVCAFWNPGKTFFF
uniref:Uncharacterized protein n=1 Tax=Anguilla anguilla TaxID=7936 RepID=A0A0E9S1Z7_ANGAN